MECPICGKKAYPVAAVRGTTTLLGAGAGSYVAATAGGQTGTAIGTLLCPGVGTVVGGALGILMGAASGAVVYCKRPFEQDGRNCLLSRVDIA